MAKELLSWREQLSRAKQQLFPESAKEDLTWEEEQIRRLEYEAAFEVALDNLQEKDQIIEWWPAEKIWHREGINYWIITELGPVPFGISPNHRKAQEKRKKWEKIRDTTIALTGQRRNYIKPPHILELQIMQSIYTYWENAQTSE
jgi:hypothetical protein